MTLPLIAVLLMAFSINISNETKIEKSSTSIQVKPSSIPSIFPVKKVDGVKISSGFGMQIHPYTKKERMHNAVDIKAPEGTPVYATANGMIRKVRRNYKGDTGYGKYLIIDHKDGYSTLYSHLSACNVNEGQEVKQGDVIGFVGNTGQSTAPHLHYEVMKDGENVNPADYF